jgi:hypothetical protein
VRVRKVCEIEDREVSREETVKAYEIDKGTLLAVSGEELREIPLSTAKAIEIAAFVPVASIDQLQVGDGYCLQADSQGAGPVSYPSEPLAAHQAERMRAHHPLVHGLLSEVMGLRATGRRVLQKRSGPKAERKVKRPCGKPGSWSWTRNDHSPSCRTRHALARSPMERRAAGRWRPG